MLSHKENPSQENIFFVSIVTIQGRKSLNVEFLKEKKK